MSYWKLIESKREIPKKKAGVYVVRDRKDGVVEFVGSAENLYSRLLQQWWFNEPGRWEVKVKLERRVGGYLMDAKRLRGRLKPRGNVVRKVKWTREERVTTTVEQLEVWDDPNFPEAPKE